MINKREQQIGVGTCVISPRAKEYVNKVLDSNRLTYGPFSQQFERAMAEAHQAKYAILVNSGTSALRIAVGALKEKYGWADGDEIILPSITFVSDVNVVTSNRLTPVLADIHPREYNLDPTKIEAKITPRTRAVLPTHLFGMAADMDPIMEIAKRHHLRIIEDACEATFARYRDKSVGAFSDVACWSTYQAHVLTTGVGGLATTSDPELAVLLRSLANHGRDGIYMQIDDDKGKSADEMKQIIQRRFSFIRPGYSYRVTEMEAAIGLAEMEDNIPESQIALRQRNAELLMNILAPFADALQVPTVPADRYHVFMMFPIVVKDPNRVSRDELINHLEAYNIETRMMLPLINQPFFIQAFGDLATQYPVAHHINNNGFYIGCHPSITAADIEYIREVFDLFFKQQTSA